MTAYPFLGACVCVLPIYWSCQSQDPNAVSPVGYFALTIDVVGQNDRRMIWIIIFHCLLYLYIMRRLWLEWQLFIKLRHGFLLRGENSLYHNPAYQRIFSNTVMVESVPG